MRQSAMLAWKRIKGWPSEGRVISAFILGLTMNFVNLAGYLRLADTIGYGTQIAECYVILGNTLHFYNGMLLGVLILMSDAPFRTSRSLYEMLRTGKKKWIAGQVFYIGAGTALYLLFMAAVLMLWTALFSKATIINEWSETITLLSDDIFDSSAFGISFPYSSFISVIRPWGAFLLTFFLNWGYAVILCLLIFGLNLLFRNYCGWIAAMAVHITGYIMSVSNAYGISISLLDRALPAQNTDQSGIMISGILFLIIICLLCRIVLFCFDKIEV